MFILFKFHWNVLPGAQLIINHIRLKQWLGADQATRNCLNQYWHSGLTHICVTRPQRVTTKCCHPSFTVSTDCSSWLFHILVPCPSSSITLISLIPACIGSVRNYRNPIQCAYHSVISLLLSGSLWSHLWNKSRTKLGENSDKLAIFACNDSFQSNLKQVTTQLNNSLVMMEWCRLALT